VAFVVEIVSVEVPEPLIELGLKAAVAAFGTGETLKTSFPEELPVETVTL
jgi:hypothetical protein